MSIITLKKSFLTMKKMKGFSLIELMVAMVVGLFVAAIVATMYVSIIRANSTTVQLARLNQDLQTSLDVMVRDIQRAGYGSGAEDALGRNRAGSPVSSAKLTEVANASFSAFSIVSGALGNDEKDLNATPSDPVGDCILIRYDANNNGVIAGNDPVEILGYKYNSVDHTIEFNSWNSVANQSCTASGWTTLAGGDGHIDITGLSFTIDPASGASSTNLQRSIIIAVSGASTKSADLDVGLERRVRLRNDQFIEE